VARLVSEAMRWEGDDLCLSSGEGRSNLCCESGSTWFTPEDCLYIYHQDANYNVAALTDKTGRPVEHYEYDLYGQARIHRGQAGWGGDDPNGCLL